MSSSYGAGFLEEALAGNMPFLPGVAVPPPLASVKFSAPLDSCAISLRGVRIRAAQVPQVARLDCFIDCDGQPVVFPTDFILYDGSQFDSAHVQEDVVGDFVQGILAIPSKGIFFSYSFPVDSVYSSDPSVSVTLSPACLELEAGAVDLYSEQQRLSLPTAVLPGYNYSISAKTGAFPSLRLSVEAGAGLGLRPCIFQDDSNGQAPSVLRTLAGAGADERGNISLQAPSGDCLGVDSVPPEHRIAVDAHCAPCCRCSDYSLASDYAKGLALDYHLSATRYNTLAKSYNSIAGRFLARQQCCSSADKLNPRFRLWPQQNFKLQVQAMVENNTSERIRVGSMLLTARFAVATNLMAVENIEGQQIPYSMAAGQPVAVLAMPDASYLYFKNLNPTSKGLAFSSTEQGRLDTASDFTQLTGVAACDQTGESPNDLEPCSGYAMITAGAMIVDPVFRKIVHLKNEPVDLNVTLTLSYVGTEPGQSPCGPMSDRVITSAIRVAKIGPNRQSVNPCPSARGSYVSYSSGGLKLKFNESVYGSAPVQITYRRLVDGEWQNTGAPSLVSITANGESEISLGSTPSGFSGTYQAVVEYILPTGVPGLNSRCRAVDGAIDEPVDIPALPFKVSSSFTVS